MTDTSELAREREQLLEELERLQHSATQLAYGAAYGGMTEEITRLSAQHGVRMTTIRQRLQEIDRLLADAR